MTLESLENFYRDELNDDANENNAADNYRINDIKTVKSKSFEFKRNIIGSTLDNNSILNAEVAVPLKCLSNFLRSLDLPLINSKKKLDLSMVNILYNI